MKPYLCAYRREEEREGSRVTTTWDNLKKLVIHPLVAENI
jgi:hypothetical protein